VRGPLSPLLDGSVAGVLTEVERPRGSSAANARLQEQRILRRNAPAGPHTKPTRLNGAIYNGAIVASLAETGFGNSPGAVREVKA